LYKNRVIDLQANSELGYLVECNIVLLKKIDDDDDDDECTASGNYCRGGIVDEQPIIEFHKVPELFPNRNFRTI